MLEDNSTKSRLVHAPAALAAATFGALLLSVIYEWGYFAIIGPEFQSFESASDYLANAVLYLPKTLILLVVATITSHYVTAPILKSAYGSKIGGWNNAMRLATIGLWVAALTVAPALGYLLGYTPIEFVWT